MKTLKVFSALALFSILFISCSQSNNAGAVYYSNNSLSEKIVISTVQQNAGNVFTSKNVNLKLASSPFFNEHLNNLELIDVINVSYAINDVSIDVSTATIKIGDMVLPNFDVSSGTTIQISDSGLISTIASILQEEGQITFSFENNFASQVDLEIDVSIEVRGTFVN
ncbi:hypothetical protein RQM59_09035 [Flavobacteriaceae bacterium S356]|uniref:Lipid/polyisoprenoid-binding YceI-like domain-containing protein n=1 Tax=Asprobacillus argus TaxID=3076534 RepID=A0ABU3LFN2_9FLAO|nr:hypothetical protein [Flavobacteriaceae bacterium S356]